MLFRSINITRDVFKHVEQQGSLSKHSRAHPSDIYAFSRDKADSNCITRSSWFIHIFKVLPTRSTTTPNNSRPFPIGSPASPPLVRCSSLYNNGSEKILGQPAALILSLPSIRRFTTFLNFTKQIDLIIAFAIQPYQITTRTEGQISGYRRATD